MTEFKLLSSWQQLMTLFHFTRNVSSISSSTEQQLPSSPGTVNLAQINKELSKRQISSSEYYPPNTYSWLFLGKKYAARLTRGVLHQSLSHCMLQILSSLYKGPIGTVASTSDKPIRKQINKTQWSEMKESSNEIWVLPFSRCDLRKYNFHSFLPYSIYPNTHILTKNFRGHVDNG